MAEARYTVQARAARKVLARATELGADAGELAREAGVDAATIDDPEARIPEDRLLTLYDLAASATGDDCFGLHVGERVDLRGFDVLGYAVMNSATVGEALDRTVRYYAIWTDGSAFATETAGRDARLRYEYRGRRDAPRRHECEATLAMVVVSIRALLDDDWTPHRVAFEHAAPTCGSEHGRVFGVRPRFGARANEIAFERALLDRRISRADASLSEIVDRHAEELLARAPTPDDIVGRVRRCLDEALRGGDPSLGAIARRLGASPRTLQRRLRDEETSHQELLDETRRALALRYVARRDVSLAEIAYLLGYSEPAAFHRAFRRWTGETPGAFRAATRHSK